MAIIASIFIGIMLAVATLGGCVGIQWLRTRFAYAPYKDEDDYDPTL